MNVNRNERLALDYREMLKIQDRPYLSWIPIKGEPPYVEEYLLTVRVRTYALRAQGGRYTVGAVDRRVIKVTLRDSYPNVAPYIKMLDIPPAFHPLWYSKGSYCPCEPWRSDEPLREYVKRMISELMYEPDMTDISAPANYKALDWYMRRRGDSSLFPSDKTELSENSAEETAASEKAAAGFEDIIDSWGIGM